MCVCVFCVFFFFFFFLGGGGVVGLRERERERGGGGGSERMGVMHEVLVRNVDFLEKDVER